MEEQKKQNPGKQVRYEYTVKLLNEDLRKQEDSLAFWKAIIDNPNAEPLSLRQAKGNISSNENRVDELKRAIEALTPPKPEAKPA